MSNEFNAVFEREGDVYIGYCLEVPGANGQGATLEECRESLRRSIRRILSDCREDGLRNLSQDAIRESIAVP